MAARLSFTFTLLLASFPAKAGDFDLEQSQWCAALLSPVRSLLRKNVEEIERTLFDDPNQIALSIERLSYLNNLDAPVHSDRVGGEKVAFATSELEQEFPGVTQMLAYVKSAGGELRRHPKENFFIDGAGRPIVRFQTRDGLSHEMDHFNRWFRFKRGLLASVPHFDEPTAARAIEAAFFTGAGSLFIESSGILVSLRDRPENPSSSGAARDFRSFLSQISYPYHSAMKGAAGDLAIARLGGDPEAVLRAEAALSDFTGRYLSFLKAVQARSRDFWHARAAQATPRQRASILTELQDAVQRGEGMLLDAFSPPARALYFTLELSDDDWFRDTAIQETSQFDFGLQAPLVQAALQKALQSP